MKEIEESIMSVMDSKYKQKSAKVAAKVKELHIRDNPFKQALVRPSWICLKLTNGDLFAAIMMAEILYKTNITKYHNGKNLVVVFSYLEWANITGLSVAQVRKGLERAKKLKLIRLYNRPHPHKPAVLRALHVEVSKAIVDLYHHVIYGGYRIVGNKLMFMHDLDVIEKIDLAVFCDQPSQKRKKKVCAVSGEMQDGGSPECVMDAHSAVYKEQAEVHQADDSVCILTAPPIYKQEYKDSNNEEYN